ncbi:hypothetical protein CAMGR0001_2216 [Campylobacter gracilis RM3268]|uniref:Uncharacterized protein n=1 Tax=Campylobacter gracilis RM3268 TaxID=553220 RepID=C8PH27_9BACT|nr:hypothetical protein CAMGR0001_2216 [Campylobacter gracilis RM3268]
MLLRRSVVAVHDIDALLHIFSFKFKPFARRILKFQSAR